METANDDWGKYIQENIHMILIILPYYILNIQLLYNFNWNFILEPPNRFTVHRKAKRAANQRFRSNVRRRQHVRLISGIWFTLARSCQLQKVNEDAMPSSWNDVRETVYSHVDHLRQQHKMQSNKSITFHSSDNIILHLQLLDWFIIILDNFRSIY